MAGVIAKVNVQDGQIVAAGSPLVEIVAESEIEVKLGLEPEDLSAAQDGARFVDHGRQWRSRTRRDCRRQSAWNSRRRHRSPSSR